LSEDQKFFDIYSLVVGGLAAFALFILIFAMWLGDSTQGLFTREGDEYKAAIAERIAPLGKAYKPGEAEAMADEAMADDVRADTDSMGDGAMDAGGDATDAVAPEAPSTDDMVAAADTSGIDGAGVYNGACVACHGAGVAGAPRVGDADAWAERITQGMDTLKSHAINGYQGQAGYMPAKGGRMDLSDAEVGAAVEYMVEESS